MKELKIGCVIMAAGNASRFGRNKLKEFLGGKTLFCRTLEAIPAHCFARMVVVSRYAEFADCAGPLPFPFIYNDSPEKGISHTIQLGLNALQGCDGVLFCVSDQPLLRRETIAQLTALWKKNPDKIAAPAHKGVRGNPCLFPARFFPELLALTGDKGGSAVIRRHEEDLVLLEVDARELMDADTPEALAEIRALG